VAATGYNKNYPLEQEVSTNASEGLLFIISPPHPASL
jgi:hypothetical protein